MIKLAYAEIDENIKEEDIKKEADVLPLFFREKNTAYINEILERKHRPSALRGLKALGLLCSLLPSKGMNTTISKTETGRPYFPYESGIDFNISHSEKMVICAICFESQNPKIGIDCEEVYKKNPIAFSERFFTKEEQRVIANAENKNHTFTEIWTKKEAYLKYTGKGLSIPLSSFDVIENPPASFQTFELCGHIISICTKAPDKISF